MAIILQPANILSDINDIDRRLRVLETAQRSASSSNSSAVETRVLTIPAYDLFPHPDGLLGAGGASVTLPQVTVTGSRFFIGCYATVSGYGPGGAFKGAGVEVNVYVGAVAAANWWFSSYVNSVDQETVQLTAVLDTTPGTYVFQQVWLSPSNAPAGSVEATISHMALVVIPLRST